MKRVIRRLVNSVIGGLSAFIFFLLQFIWWVFSPTTLVPMWVLVLVVLLCYLICLITYAICSVRTPEVYRLPSIKGIVKTSGLVFVVERNDLFSQGAYVTICYQEDEEGLETILGLGYVQTVNSAGFLQIVMEKQVSDNAVEEICRKIDNTSYFRKAIKIKPRTDKELIEEAIQNG